MTRHYQAGELIFSEGDEGNYAYIVEEGQVEIWTVVNGDRLVLNVLEPGRLFGELALVDWKPRSASASALNDCILSVVTPEQVSQRLEAADPILRLLLLVVMDSFRSETTNFRGKTAPEPIIPSLTHQPKLCLEQRIKGAVDLIRLEGELRDAINDQQFRLVYQPIYHIQGGQLEGFEALIRWHSPKRGFVPPDQFISLAEASDLIIPIGEWVIKQGLADLLTLQEQFQLPLLMSFNIVSRQTESANFLSWLLETVNDQGVKPSSVKLEIIERTLFSQDSLLPWIQQCRSEGFSLVLDDFGTGYSSLQYLNEYQIDRVKIDRSFVKGLEENLNSRSICKAILNLAHGLDMSVVAEGIETQEQLEILRGLGCEYGQGYLFAKPLPLEQALVIKSNLDF
jgi:EAL domain-containing protein (putative c-di-GMP-specific phosphodiesterase class I)